MIIPTYNEKDNIREIVQRISSACSSIDSGTEIVIVDDNSPDGTAAFAEGLTGEYNIKVVRRAGKLGLSSAVIEGISAASGSILVVMDADLSHPPEKIPAMVSRITGGEADMVVGSRYAPGGSVENWPIYRRIVSKGATLLARGLTKVKDPMSGFFALRRSAIDGVTLDPIGYKIALEIMARGKISRVVEEPIRFADRKAGKSKLGASEYLKYIDHVIRLYEHKRWWLSKYLKFAFIGGIGTLINLAIFWVLLEIFDVNYLLAAVVSFCVAATNNFLMNRVWTFRSKGRIQVQYFQFMLVSVAGLMLNLIVLKFLVEEFFPWLGFSGDRASILETFSNFLAILLVSIFNFFVNSFWTFSKDMERQV
ncbi:MAG TPA: glycosyltransferase family 2 protein [Euryarchaeota archaeon]|nr:glycosyltransferase family 2 protein [Euryarchaeota archaeon]